MRYVPNALTGIRFIGALCLFFFEPLGLPFYVVYSVCGISDVLDGYIARKYHVACQMGALFDSIADLLFYGVTLWNVMDYLIKDMDLWLWLWLFVVLIIRCIIYVEVAIRYHRFAAIHTYANKACGFFLFFLPFVLLLSGGREGYYVVALAVAMYAAVEEFAIYWIGQEYDGDCKSIFSAMRKKKMLCTEMD